MHYSSAAVLFTHRMSKCVLCVCSFSVKPHLMYLSHWWRGGSDKFPLKRMIFYGTEIGRVTRGCVSRGSRQLGPQNATVAARPALSLFVGHPVKLQAWLMAEANKQIMCRPRHIERERSQSICWIMLFCNASLHWPCLACCSLGVVGCGQNLALLHMSPHWELTQLLNQWRSVKTHVWS